MLLNCCFHLFLDSFLLGSLSLFGLISSSAFLLFTFVLSDTVSVQTLSLKLTRLWLHRRFWPCGSPSSSPPPTDRTIVCFKLNNLILPIFSVIIFLSQKHCLVLSLILISLNKYSWRKYCPFYCHHFFQNCSLALFCNCVTMYISYTQMNFPPEEKVQCYLLEIYRLSSKNYIKLHTH